jgi:hypothetical protein
MEGGVSWGYLRKAAVGDPRLLISSPSRGDTAAHGGRVWLLDNGDSNIALWC